MIGENKLLLDQSYPFGREWSTRKGCIWVAKNHFDLGVYGREVFHSYFYLINMSISFVKKTVIPCEHSIVYSLPVSSLSVASFVITIQGRPSSRLTMYVWQFRRPRFVMTSEAILIAGTQSGSVNLATIISPGCIYDIADMYLNTQTLSYDASLPIEVPSISVSPWQVTHVCVIVPYIWWDRTVSGLAWKIKSSPVNPSFAHSIYIVFMFPWWYL